jgi:hypothetical protein
VNGDRAIDRNIVKQRRTTEDRSSVNRKRIGDSEAKQRRRVR